MSHAQLAHIQALFEKALHAHKRGDFLAAKPLYEQALALKPDDTGILQNLGMLCVTHGRYQEGAFYLQRAGQTGARTPALFKALGIALARIGQNHEAVQAFTQYRTTNPHDTDITQDYLQSCLNTGAYDDILRFAENEAAGHPQADIIHIFAAEAEMARADPFAAITRLEAARGPRDDAAALILLPALAKAYGQARRFDDALKAAQTCVDHDADNAMYWNNLGNALKNAGQTDAALDALARARTLDARLAAPTLSNAAAIYKQRRDIDAAIDSTTRALEIDPLNAQARYMHGTLNVMAGDYKTGWPMLEWRWHAREGNIMPPPEPYRLWYGEKLDGKILALYADQGIGDTLMMLRYLPVIKDRFKPESITVIAQKKLQNLFALNFPDVTFVAGDEQRNAFKTTKHHYLAAFCSLPAILGTTWQYIPPCPVLQKRDDKTYATPDKPFVIGLSWHTTSLNAGYKRAAVLKDFAFLADQPNVTIVDLQYGDTADERAAAGFAVVHDDCADSWADVQCLIDQIHACDLVVSIDNTTVHAAACCGKPVWTLLPYDPYWRWHDGPSTPWYPSMRLFRQQTAGDYTAPLQDVAAELQKMRTGDKTPLTPPPCPLPLRAATPAPQKSAVLLNDTYAWYHWGCTATSTAIRKKLHGAGYDVTSVHHREIADARQPAPRLPSFDDPRFLAEYRYLNPTLFASMAATDCVVINGEGTIHGMADNALRLLYLAYVAKTVFGKPVHIINHACYPQDSMTLSDPNVIAYYLKGYRAADTIAVRDEGSHTLLSQLGFTPTLAFDSLPLTARDWRQSLPAAPARDPHHIVLAGSSKFSPQQTADFHTYLKDRHANGDRLTCLLGAYANPAADDRDFTAMLRAAPVPVNFVNATTLEEWFSILASATVLVSGRFHYTIAAACFGTPFIAFEGNTPKLDFLAKDCGTPAPLRYDQQNLYHELTARTASGMAVSSAFEAQKTLEKLCTLATGNYGFLK